HGGDASRSRLGPRHRRKPAIPAGRLVVLHVPGTCDFSHRAGLQPRRRRPARHRRSAAAALAMTPLLDIHNLRLSIKTDEGTARLLDHVALALAPGRILGGVGESGCGKSALVRAVLGILPQATTVEAGKILFEGEDLLQLDERELAARVRGGRIGFIPQDPYLALNPVFTIGS